MKEVNLLPRKPSARARGARPCIQGMHGRGCVSSGLPLQAKDRAHRLGQQRQVMVLVLVCPRTVEEVILEASERKRSLDAKVIQAGLFNEASTAADRQRALQEVLHTGPSAASSARTCLL